MHGTNMKIIYLQFTTYKSEITTTILITNILLVWRVQFMAIGCQKGTQVKKKKALETAALKD